MHLLLYVSLSSLFSFILYDLCVYVCFIYRSCWLELADVCIAQSVTLPSWDIISEGAPESTIVSGRIMFDAFSVHLYLEKQDGTAALEAIQPLLQVFPNSGIVASQV